MSAVVLVGTPGLGPWILGITCGCLVVECFSMTAIHPCTAWIFFTANLQLQKEKKKKRKERKNTKNKNLNIRGPQKIV